MKWRGKRKSLTVDQLAEDFLEHSNAEDLRNYIPRFLRAQGKGWGSSTTKFEVSVVKGLLENLNEDIVFFDIGANVGNYTRDLLNEFPNSKVVAFEPSHAAYETLRGNLAFDERVTLVNLACGRSEYDAQLYSDFPGSGMASLAKRRLDHFGLINDFSENVRVTTLDAWCHTNLVWPKVIKMDVEGYELDVLHGALEALERVALIQFEFGGCNIDTRTYFQDFWYFFKEKDFRLFRISPTGPVRIDEYSEFDECFSTTNYIALSKQLTNKEIM
jgi:FkbM family methyltransferase